MTKLSSPELMYVEVLSKFTNYPYLGLEHVRCQTEGVRCDGREGGHSLQPPARSHPLPVWPAARPSHPHAHPRAPAPVPTLLFVAGKLAYKQVGKQAI